MNIALWIVQVLLALFFGAVGMVKIITPIEELTMMPWTQHVPEMAVLLSGIVEVAAAAGLILPSLTRILPKLTPLASLGLAIVMILAIGLHISLGETVPVFFNIVLGGLSLFVTYGRWKLVPIDDGKS